MQQKRKKNGQRIRYLSFSEKQGFPAGNFVFYYAYI